MRLDQIVRYLVSKSEVPEQPDLMLFLMTSNERDHLPGSVRVQELELTTECGIERPI